MAETHPGSAASEPDKAGDGVQVTALLQPGRVTLDNISVYFMEKEKVPLCQGFGVGKAL